MTSKLLLVPIVTALAAALFAVAHGASADEAGPPYPSGATGYDIGTPGCGSSPAGLFGVVQVTGGRAFYHNPCLSRQFADAAGRPYAPSLYMNLNAPAGTTAGNGMSGPKGDCAKKDKACQAYNYGYNAANDAFFYAMSQRAAAGVWWLDVELANTWAKDKSLNRLTVQGAIDALAERGATVGVYSTGYQWRTITGGMELGIPNWVAGASSRASAPQYCGSPFTGPGARVWLVQFPNGGFDGDYVC
jgi:hypothetical protein